ncbi:MAG TPA: ABC transporter permease [Thermoanaerobaculia bacterium]|nr:ABC transporter permease [Thermoanaerobaculia bacterium]
MRAPRDGAPGSAERWYRLALRAFPEAFRREYGRDLEQAHRDGLRRADGRLGRLGWTAAACWDAVVEGLAERRRAASPRPGRGATTTGLPWGRHHPTRSKTSMTHHLWADLGYAARSLRRSPGFTWAAVLTLSLGIGANASIFSVLHGVLFRPLPYEQPERLVRVFEESEDLPRFPVSPGNFRDYRERATSLSSLVVYTRVDAELSGMGEPRRLAGMVVSAGFFETLGRPPARGRGLRLEDELPGAERTAVLGGELAVELSSRGDGSGDLLGSKIVLDGVPHTVVGIAPSGLEHVGGSYRSLPQGARVDVWRPLRLDPENASRGSHFLNAIGRLAPGVTAEQAGAELQSISQRLAEEHPDQSTGWDILVVPLREEIVASSRPLLFTLSGAVVLLLLLACANVANLLLARGAERRGELAIRGSLGAGRGRLARMLLTESGLLALLGSVGGVLLAGAAIALFHRTGDRLVPRAHEVGLDPWMLGFALALGLATALLFGTLPAVRAARVAVAPAGGRRVHGSRGLGLLRGGLVVAQLAVALMLVLGATLLARSLGAMLAEDPGFEVDHVLTARIDLPAARYPDEPEVNGFWSELLRRVEAAPGVDAAGLGSDLPWSGWDENLTLNAEGSDRGGDDMIRTRYHQATPGYFEALGTAVLAGRFLREGDGEGGGREVVVNRALVETAWPEIVEAGPELAIGRRVSWSSRPDPDDWFTIVGVLADVKDGPAEPATVPSIYYPLPLWSARSMRLVMRGEAEPGVLADTVDREVRRLDPSLPVTEVTTLAEVTRAPLRSPRFASTMVALFGALALLLAMLGLAGVVAYSVARRRSEVAVRMALGATGRSIARQFLAWSAVVTASGVVIGLAGALGLGRLVAGLLYGVEPHDATSMAVASALLLAVGLIAGAVPARRAARIDPARTLQAE